MLPDGIEHHGKHQQEDDQAQDHQHPAQTLQAVVHLVYPVEASASR
jgi:hypothetical protein